MTILVSHEFPTKYLPYSLDVNDFDYALAHLFEKDPEYKAFYRDAISEGRTVFLDNGAFELGASIDSDKLIDIVKDLKPTHVFAPDVVGDYRETLERTLAFNEKIRDFPVQVIAVIHGQNLQEYIDCYTAYANEGFNWIAIPYDINGFEDIVRTKCRCITKTQIHAFSRVLLTNELIRQEILDYSIQHHYLGVSDPCEFLHYKGEQYKFITSVDTSCPIVLAMKGKELSVPSLNGEKIKDKLADNLDTDLNMNLVHKNCDIFKKFYLRRTF